MTRRGFTLVELLMVVAIMAMLTAVALSIPRADHKRIAVEAAARELAGTLQVARNLALQRRASYAVAFNVSNAPGTSGAVINNWSGGHWYQIIGPGDSTKADTYLGYSHPEPALATGFSLVDFLDQVKDAWYGEKHTLAARKVRFLALSDQDSGMVRVWDRADAIDNRTFPSTYPRPWCGWWDEASGRLHAWGGYDPRRTGATPTIKDTKNRNPTGFYFEGSNGAIADSRHPGADRLSTIDSRTLLAGGAGRALVNADWMDSYIQFRPDGTATFGRFGQLRTWSYSQKGTAIGGAATGLGDLGDFAASFSWSWSTGVIDQYSEQASHYESRTGYWYLTLAPDAEADSDVFLSAASAAKSMMPAIRVGVNAFGEVRTVPVRAALPAGAQLDDWITPNQWQTYTITTGTSGRYQRNMMTAVNGTPRGLPIVDALIPEMLSARMWWLKP